LEGAIFIVALRRNYKNRSLLKGFTLPAAAKNYVNVLHEKLLKQITNKAITLY
jgi:hypothetical protein